MAGVSPERPDADEISRLSIVELTSSVVHTGKESPSLINCCLISIVMGHADTNFDCRWVEKKQSSGGKEVRPSVIVWAAFDKLPFSH